MSLKILPSAFDDLAEGRVFYEIQGGKALGEYFFNTLFSDIDSLTLYAGTHRMIDDRFYRMLSKRFPYAIYYLIVEDVVAVWRVLDERQDPEAIEVRLKEGD